MDFYEWSFYEPLLKINKYGIPEPEIKNISLPRYLINSFSSIR